MKKLLCLFLSLLLLSGCTTVQTREKSTYLDVFDTVTTIIGDTAAAEEIHDELLRYHRLFDIYNTYEGINNLKTVNDRAGISPVEVEEAVIELLSDCMECGCGILPGKRAFSIPKAPTFPLRMPLRKLQSTRTSQISSSTVSIPPSISRMEKCLWMWVPSPKAGLPKKQPSPHRRECF